MTSILGSTESVVRGLTKVNIAQRVIMTRKYENQLNALMRKLTEIHNSPAFQNLVSKTILNDFRVHLLISLGEMVFLGRRGKPDHSSSLLPVVVWMTPGKKKVSQPIREPLLLLAEG